ncbi:MAG: response regulator transcription factor [Pseudomonadales bacterium]
MEEQTHLLIADDDVGLCTLLTTYLEGENFTVDSVYSGTAALEQVRQREYSLMILDIMLPGLNGLDVLRGLREHSDLPVLMLTAKGDDIDRIVGLELGADDYLPKPCNPRELLARIRAILRRAVDDPRANDSASLQVGSLTLSPTSRQVNLNDVALDLTSVEFAVLCCLMRQSGQIVGRDELSVQGLGRKLMPYDRSIDVHISKLRKKIAAIDDSQWIVAVRSQGYQLVAPE